MILILIRFIRLQLVKLMLIYANFLYTLREFATLAQLSNTCPNIIVTKKKSIGRPQLNTPDAFDTQVCVLMRMHYVTASCVAPKTHWSAITKFGCIASPCSFNYLIQTTRVKINLLAGDNVKPMVWRSFP